MPLLIRVFNTHFIISRISWILYFNYSMYALSRTWLSSSIFQLNSYYTMIVKNIIKSVSKLTKIQLICGTSPLIGNSLFTLILVEELATVKFMRGCDCKQQFKVTVNAMIEYLKISQVIGEFVPILNLLQTCLLSHENLFNICLTKLYIFMVGD